jgi:diaminopimelate epimerase
MSTDYRIEPAGNAFMVIDDAGEQVDTYPTEDAAKQLVDTAIMARMGTFGVDRKTARYWISSAAEAAD